MRFVPSEWKAKQNAKIDMVDSCKTGIYVFCTILGRVIVQETGHCSRMRILIIYINYTNTRSKNDRSMIHDTMHRSNVTSQVPVLFQEKGARVKDLLKRRATFRGLSSCSTEMENTNCCDKTRDPTTRRMYVCTCVCVPRANDFWSFDGATITWYNRNISHSIPTCV